MQFLLLDSLYYCRLHEREKMLSRMLWFFFSDAVRKHWIWESGQKRNVIHLTLIWLRNTSLTKSDNKMFFVVKLFREWYHTWVSTVSKSSAYRNDLHIMPAQSCASMFHIFILSPARTCFVLSQHRRLGNIFLVQTHRSISVFVTIVESRPATGIRCSNIYFMFYSRFFFNKCFWFFRISDLICALMVTQDKWYKTTNIRKSKHTEC